MSDVLVIGGGLAGWRAAEAAVKAGVSVTLVANGAGNSPDVHALNCPVRPEDSVACYVADTLTSGRHGNDPALVETMCRESLTLKDEFAFDDTVIRPLGSTVPRCVSIDHAIGAKALAAIKVRLAGRMTELHETVTVERLLAWRRESPQLAVILATGGWCGRYDFSTNPSYLKGDGLAFAEALGGALRDVDEAHVQYEPTVRVCGTKRGIPVITTLLYEGAKLVNDAGEAFLPDARLNKDELSRAIAAEMAKTGADGVWYDLTGVADAAIAACKMDLAERRIRVAPAPHTSLGGVVIDTACRVLNAEGKVVPGLFAAGEVTAGVHGFNRLGGNGGTAAMVFGRIAGESAATWVLQKKGNVQ